MIIILNYIYYILYIIYSIYDYYTELYKLHIVHNIVYIWLLYGIIYITYCTLYSVYNYYIELYINIIRIIQKFYLSFSPVGHLSCSDLLPKHTKFPLVVLCFLERNTFRIRNSIKTMSPSQPLIFKSSMNRLPISRTWLFSLVSDK